MPTFAYQSNNTVHQFCLCGIALTQNHQNEGVERPIWSHKWWAFLKAQEQEEICQTSKLFSNAFRPSIWMHYICQHNKSHHKSQWPVNTQTPHSISLHIYDWHIINHKQSIFFYDASLWHTPADDGVPVEVASLRKEVSTRSVKR